MDSLRLINFRSFVDTNQIDFAPITLFVGANGSGKSSFIRSLPLLKQSFEKKTREPVLWFGEYVDFGNFTTTKNNQTDKKFIGLEFVQSFNSNENRENFYFDDVFYYSHFWHTRENTTRLEKVKTKVILGTDIENRTRITNIDLTLEENLNIQIDLRQESNAKIKINNRLFQNTLLSITSHHFADKFLPVIAIQSANENTTKNSFSEAITGSLPVPLIISLIIKELDFMVHGNTSRRKRLSLISSLQPNNEEILLRELSATYSQELGGKKAQKNMVKDQKFIDFYDLYILSTIPAIIEKVNEKLAVFSQDVRYVKPIRATAERYYREQELAVDQIDPQGKNFATFIKSLNAMDLASLNKWLSEHFNFSIRSEMNGSHLALMIYDNVIKSYVNLADTGFGYSQILPILASVWLEQTRKNHRNRATSIRTFVIEQPELHLHPQLQASFAIMLANVAKKLKSSVRFIIETHSQAIIAKLGEEIAEEHLSPDDVKVYLVSRESSSKGSEITLSTFNEEGFLQNWPIGFLS